MPQIDKIAFSSDFYGFYEKEGIYKKVINPITNVFNAIFNRFIADGTEAKQAVIEIKALMIVFEDYGANDSACEANMYLVLEEIYPNYDFTDKLSG